MKRPMIAFVFCFIAILTFRNAYCDDWREAIIWIYDGDITIPSERTESNKTTKMDVKIKHKKNSFICNVPLDRIAKIEIKEIRLKTVSTDRLEANDQQVIFAKLSLNYEYKITGFKNQTETCTGDKNNIKKIIVDDGFKIVEFNIGEKFTKSYFKKPKFGEECYEPLPLIDFWMKNHRSQIKKIEFKN